MRADTNLGLISGKIDQLHHAVFYSMSTELVKLPNCIATAVKIEEDGQLWFVCDKPVQDVSQCPESFPVRLHFYKKGIAFHIEVSGQASIVNQDYKGCPELNKPLLVKMNMEKVEYTESKEFKKSRFAVKLEKVFNWIVTHTSIPRHQKSVLELLQGMNHS